MVSLYQQALLGPPGQDSGLLQQPHLGVGSSARRACRGCRCGLGGRPGRHRGQGRVLRQGVGVQGTSGLGLVPPGAMAVELF